MPVCSLTPLRRGNCMKKVFENLILLLVVFLCSCGPNRCVEGDVECFERGLESDLFDLEPYQGVAYADNVDCEIIDNEDHKEVCLSSNNSYERVLGFKSFSSDIATVFIPIESWDEFLSDIDMESYIGMAAGFCTGTKYVFKVKTSEGYKNKEFSETIFISWREDNILNIKALNHERVHCELDKYSSEVMSEFLEWHTVLDYLISSNQSLKSSSFFDEYEITPDLGTHNVGRYIFSKYMQKWYEENGNFDELLNDYPATVKKWTSKDWKVDKVQEIDPSITTDAVKMFAKEFIKKNRERLYPYECSEKEIYGNMCTIAYFLDILPDRSNHDFFGELPNHILRIDYKNQYLSPKMRVVRVVSGGDYPYVDSSYIPKRFNGDWYSSIEFGSKDVVSFFYISVLDDSGSEYLVTRNSFQGELEIISQYLYQGEKKEEILYIKETDVCDSITILGHEENMPGVLVALQSTSTTKTVQLLPCQ